MAVLSLRDIRRPHGAQGDPGRGAAQQQNPIRLLLCPEAFFSPWQAWAWLVPETGEDEWPAACRDTYTCAESLSLHAAVTDSDMRVCRHQGRCSLALHSVNPLAIRGLLQQQGPTWYGC